LALPASDEEGRAEKAADKESREENLCEEDAKIAASP
jgi:hypothetical protein